MMRVKPHMELQTRREIELERKQIELGQLPNRPINKTKVVDPYITEDILPQLPKQPLILKS